MKKTIYVATSGEYSDYRICAVFDDRELALKYNDGEENGIEEWELNPGEKRLREGIRVYSVRMDRDGNVEQCFPSWSDGEESESVDYFLSWTHPGPSLKKYRFTARVVCASEEQAVKAANERRARYLANGGPWPPDEQPDPEAIKAGELAAQQKQAQREAELARQKWDAEHPTGHEQPWNLPPEQQTWVNPMYSKTEKP